MSGIDITEFDSVSACEAGHEFELKAADGVTGTGVTLVVIGKHADPVNKWINKVVNASMIEQQIAARKGKQVAPKSLDDLRDQNIEGAMVRVIGWKGVRQEFSADLLRSAFKRNPHWVDQVIAESDELANFSGAQSPT